MNIWLWVLGALLGVRHAFEPDHMAAVAALVTGPARTSSATRLGATWGLGHSAALLLAATLIALGRSTLHASVGDAFEILVGVMLVALGAFRLAGGLRRLAGGLRRRAGAGLAPAVSHDGAPFTVGVVHGLAGSGALTALAASQLQSTAGRLAYVALFGLGSILGMSALAGLGGRLLSRLAARPGVVAGLALATGALTLAVGVIWLRRFWP